MNNLLLYIQALPCHSLMALLQHAKVENDTVYVSNKDYGDAYCDAQHNFGLWYRLDVMAKLDTIIHNKFNCSYFQFIENPNRKYYWDEEERQYYIGQATK